MIEPSAPNPPGWVRAILAQTDGSGATTGRPPVQRGHRPAAVLVLLSPGADGRGEVLLIERTPTLRQHPGQPAFPGGAQDLGDPNPAATALREAAEEIGLDPGGVRVVGLLPELSIGVSGFRVTPVLAWWPVPHEVGPCGPAEVARVVQVGLDELADPSVRCSVRHPGGTIGPAFAVHGLLVWGFTATVLDLVLDRAGRTRPWAHDPVRALPPAAGVRRKP